MTTQPEVTDLPLDEKVQEISVEPIQQPVSDDDLVEDIGNESPAEEAAEGEASIWGGSFAPRKARPSGGR